jgi:hypothetical protein
MRVAKDRELAEPRDIYASVRMPIRWPRRGARRNEDLALPVIAQPGSKKMRRHGRALAA